MVINFISTENERTRRVDEEKIQLIQKHFAKPRIFREDRVYKGGVEGLVESIALGGVKLKGAGGIMNNQDFYDPTSVTA